MNALLVMEPSESRHLATILAKHEIEAYQVARVRQAVSLLEYYRQVDVILTDLDFQENDCEQFLRHMQGNQQLKRIPVIAYTQTIERDRALQLAGLGVHDFLIRPCREEVLVQKIRQVVERDSGSVLVVDDEPIVRDLLAQIVEREGFRVTVAADGSEALETMARQKVSLVITDLMMPGMSGMDLLVEVKDKYPETPVVFVTGRRTDAARDNAIAAGADGYITKPFKNLEIAKKIESLISA